MIALWVEDRAASRRADSVARPGRVGQEQANSRRADGKQPTQWDVEAGWYVLRISPVKDAAGILDLTFGQPGIDVDHPGAG